MATLKEQQFQLREKVIIDAMYHLLVQKGYSATSMDDVAAHVGISKATLYLHFKSKTELALRVIVQQIDNIASAIRSLDPGLPALDRIKRTLYDGIQSRVRLGAAQIHLMPEEIYRNAEYQAAQWRMAEVGTRLIEEAQREGTIRSDLPASLIQQFIANTFNMDIKHYLGQQISLEQVAEQIFDLVLRAIRP